MAERLYEGISEETQKILEKLKGSYFYILYCYSYPGYINYYKVYILCISRFTQGSFL